MSRATLIAAIQSFLKLLQHEGGDEQDKLRRLAQSLDQLTAAYYLTTDVEPSTDDVEPPRADYHQLAELASRAFPTLGCYASVEPTLDFDQSIGVSDAIDDLADIARDLMDVLWLLENARDADAVWDFRFGYQTHWGEHLHSLRLYLNSSTIAAW